MKSIFTSLFVALALAGCDDPTPPRSAELEQARRQTVKAEERARENQQSRDRWQSLTLSVIVGAVVLLFVGAALGSKARHDAGRN